MRMTRTMMLEVLRQDYIRTAWSKGLRERVVVMRHAVKNALIPVVSLIGLQLPILIGGSVIMENIFSLPGLGRLMLVALEDRDYPVVSGVNLFFATAVLIGLQLPILIGGSVIMENIFSLPGLGRLMLVALEDRDYPVVSGVNLFFATAVVLFNLLIDLLYTWLDPRVRYD